MDNILKKCIREINRNQDIEKNIPLYVEKCMYYSSSHAYVKLAMEYYMFYETVSEKINPHTSPVMDNIETFNGIIREFTGKKTGSGECMALADRLLALRKEIIDKMQVITAYVDCFVIYEYIFNRLQYKFEEMGTMPDDAEFIQKVINFVFGIKDNVTINENIRFITGQLPMRMLRSRYFDIIHESVSIYKGNPVNALESFEYMFRTNAMLYKDENMDIYFTGFRETVEELKDLDYDNINEDLYTIYSGKVNTNAQKLAAISDLYMQLGELVNSAYIIVSAAVYADGQVNEDTGTDGDAGIIIRGINSLFMENESSVWDNAGEGIKSDDEKISWLSGFLDKITGQQESIGENLDMAEAVLDETVKSQEEVIESLGLTEEFTVLGRMSLLNSSSTFADITLKEKEDDREVTADMAEKTAASLVNEVKELFKGRSRIFRRAVMANTLDKMPVFFNNPQEVADYISDSLIQCGDNAEKYASKEIILNAIM